MFVFSSNKHFLAGGAPIWKILRRLELMQWKKQFNKFKFSFSFIMSLFQQARVVEDQTLVSGSWVKIQLIRQHSPKTSYFDSCDWVTSEKGSFRLKCGWRTVLQVYVNSSNQSPLASNKTLGRVPNGVNQCCFKCNFFFIKSAPAALDQNVWAKKIKYRGGCCCFFVSVAASSGARINVAQGTPGRSEEGRGGRE